MYNVYSRHLRHIVLPSFGITSQDVLKKSKILCVGTGGLGSPVITYLTMLGVGNIGIIDFDYVETSNLNRQFIFKDNDIGKSKVLLAQKYIKNLNKDIHISVYNTLLNHNNCLHLFKNYNVVIDCTDNLNAKLLISDSAIKINIPVVHGSIFGFEGYVTIFNKNYNCYRCTYSSIKINNCIDYGVFGPTAGIIGIIQASETIKILLNKNITLKSKLLIIDLENLKFKCININKKKCIIC